MWSLLMRFLHSCFLRMGDNLVLRIFDFILNNDASFNLCL
jgi:hypothetical protein